MDSTMNHPWIELQLLIKEKWLTQKAFATILWKKVSEVNELLKWKRNITIQRDYLLHQTLWTPIKYWILKQVDYDYSLLDIEETDDLSSWALAKDLRWKTEELDTQDSSSQTPQNNEGDANNLGSVSMTNQNFNSEQNKNRIEPELNWVSANTSFWTKWRIQENIKPIDSSADKSVSEWQEISQETPIQEQGIEINKDLKNRANIFRNF